MENRSRQIIRTSLVGIAVNVILVIFKLAVGLAVHSIAVILDAVNNFSDALSSVITIAGTRMAGKAPDRKHPYGHGRIEYLTGMVIAIIVLAAGLSSLKESVTKILHPEEASYTGVSLLIIAVAVAAKLALGLFVRRRGQALKAQALVASGSDALFDAVLSLTTLIAAAISILWGLSLEAWFGALISLFIIKSGLEMLSESAGSIIGDRADAALTDALRARILSFPGVLGVYDLTLHNYGPARTIGTAHIEVPDAVTARELHLLTRRIAVAAAEEFGLLLTLGVYSAGDSQPGLKQMRDTLAQIAGRHPEVLQFHGFLADEAQRAASFDLIVDFSADAQAVRETVLREAGEAFPGWSFDVILDTDFSESED